MKTSLGIWAFGTMATRFVPGGYQPQWADETTAQRVRRAVEGLGDLIDDYEFHYPQELSPDNLDEVREALGGHGIYAVATGLHLDSKFGRGGLVNPDAAIRAEAVRAHPRCGRLRRQPRRTLHHLAGDRGLQLPVPDPVRGVVGVADRRGRAGGRAGEDPRDQDLPRAQELRAGDEDPHAQRRHDAAHHPQAADAGDRQRPGQHGLAAPDHERREPRRVRGAPRRRGTARTPARERRLGHVRRRQHGRHDPVHGDDRARGRAAPRRTTATTASGSASISIRIRRTRSPPSGAACCTGGSSSRSRRRSTAPSCVPRSRTRTPSPRTSSCIAPSGRSGASARSSTSTGRSSTPCTRTSSPGSCALDEAGLPIDGWRIHRRIGMSGGLFTRAVARRDRARR